MSLKPEVSSNGERKPRARRRPDSPRALMVEKPAHAKCEAAMRELARCLGMPMFGGS